jgi:hypothetical protein
MRWKYADTILLSKIDPSIAIINVIIVSFSYSDGHMLDISIQYGGKD